jgi:hypothetical protein
MFSHLGKLCQGLGKAVVHFLHTYPKLRLIALNGLQEDEFSLAGRCVAYIPGMGGGHRTCTYLPPVDFTDRDS